MKDVVIVGGGASGVCVAIEIKKINKNLNVLILEQNDKVLKKLLKTGNGKCNISNSNITKEKYNDFSLIESNMKNIDINQYFFDLGLILKETDLNRVYPYSENSGSVVNIFLEAIRKYNIEVITNYKVSKIEKENDLFVINNKIKSKYLILSTGSCAQEKTNGYDIIRSFDINVSKLEPGLVNLETKESTIALKGLRIKCKTVINNQDYYGELLFKDNGLSGIISFDISRVVTNNDIVLFDLAPEFTEKQLYDLLTSNNLDIVLNGLFPKMVSLDLIKRSNRQIDKLIKEIKSYKFTIKGKGSFENAQIALGGVYVDELKNNFESKKISNLYITGEVINVDGASGGYNLYFAWLSGITAARSIANN